MPETRPTTATAPEKISGLGKVLIFFYGLLALAATGRSVVQILTKFDEAPLAYTLSAISAVVYIVATVALIVKRPAARKVATASMMFELVGVIAVGFASIFEHKLFPHDTVWSYFGAGYIFIPLVLPVLGLTWMRKSSRRAALAPRQ